MTPQDIREAQVALGRELHARRRAAGLTQMQLAAATFASRSSVACIETGRQNADCDFWERADAVTGANGALLAAYENLRCLRLRHAASQSKTPLGRRDVLRLSAVGASLTATLALPSTLRTQLIAGGLASDPGEGDDSGTPSLADLTRQVGLAHDAYQRARYRQAAEAVAEILARLAGRSNEDGGGHACGRPVEFELVAAVNILAAKLAAKVGDGALAWVAADRACTAAEIASDPALRGVGAYQVACALAQSPEPGRLDDAMTVIDVGLTRLAGNRRSPRTLSARGALELHGSIVAARLGDAMLSRGHLRAATRLAEDLGADGNHLRTAFGPTNVRIHEVAVELAMDRPDEAIRRGEAIDTTQLPPALVGRRAQIHIDLARAWTLTGRDDGQGLLHLLEAERLGSDVVAFNHAARTTVTQLLARERPRRMPGLAALADRIGVLA